MKRLKSNRRWSRYERYFQKLAAAEKDQGLARRYLKRRRYYEMLAHYNEFYKDVDRRAIEAVISMARLS